MKQENQKDIDLNNFKERLQRLNWNYSRSDDTFIYRRGQQEFSEALREKQRLMILYPEDDFFIRQIWDHKGRI